jgi:carbonic anhydrase/acetyltransferase-like protein (isoleucine patch superfamily)
MIIQRDNDRPIIHETAYIAPNAIISGNVTIGANCRIMYGAIISAESGSVLIDDSCIVMENAVIRSTSHFPTTIGNNVLIGPHAHLSGCSIEDGVFVATGSSIFSGAYIGTQSTIKINGVVHIKTRLPQGSVVPIGWIAIGDPVEILSPDQDERITELLKELDFPKTVFGIDREILKGNLMTEMTNRYGQRLLSYERDVLLDEI